MRQWVLDLCLCVAIALLPWEQAGEFCPVRTSPCNLGTRSVQLAGLLHAIPDRVCCKYTLAVLLPCPRAANKQGVGPGKQKSLCLALFFFFFSNFPCLFFCIV